MVACGYALGYYALRQMSFSQWAVFAGFRATILLLTPYRFWPSLLASEFASLIWLSGRYVDQFGLAWAAAFVVPPMGPGMAIVYWFRRTGRLLVAGRHVDMNGVLACSFVLAVTWATLNSLSLLLVDNPAGDHASYARLGLGYFLGQYLGILTLTPLILALREHVRESQLSGSFVRFLQNRMFAEMGAIFLPSIVLLAWLAKSTEGPLSQACRMAMFLPVAWLSLKYGWEGAAIGGSLASVAMALVVPLNRYDFGFAEAQTFLAITITVMLLLGARIAALNAPATGSFDAPSILALARRNIHSGEMRLRQASIALKRIDGFVHPLAASQWQSLSMPPTSPASYLAHVAEVIYPEQWQGQGLLASLRHGAIAMALAAHGVWYRCTSNSRNSTSLSPMVQMCLYRSTLEAVALLCLGQPVIGVSISVRMGRHPDRSWGVIKATVLRGRRGATMNGDWALLSTEAPGLDPIRDRLAVFEGKVRMRHSDDAKSITLMAREPLSSINPHSSFCSGGR